MNEACNILNPLQRDGVSQRQRLVKALHPSYVSVDERELKDYLLYARKYAALLRYYSPQNNPDGDWTVFIENDITTLTAIIANTDLKTQKKDFESEIEEWEVKVKENQGLSFANQLNSIGHLFKHHYKLAKQANSWLIYSLEGLSLKRELKKVIAAILTDTLQNTRALAQRVFDLTNLAGDKPIAANQFDIFWNLTDPVSPNLRVLPDPATRSLDEQKDDLLYFSKRLKQEYKKLYDGLFSIVQKGEVFLNETLTDYPHHTPHITLFLTFLCIFKIARDHLNTLTRRHLNFYYRDVLGLKPNPPKPDSVYMVFELAKNFNLHQIEENTALKAGKDANGTNRTFRTDEELIVNKTKLAENGLKSIFIDKKNGVVQNIHAAPIANSMDGLGGDIEEEDGKWLTFGDSSMPNAKIGFAIASPIFYLKEGNRTLILTFHFEKSTLLKKQSGNSQNNAIAHELKYNLKAFYSGEKEWQQAVIEEVKINLQEDSENNEDTITLTIVLDSGAEPFLKYDNKKLKDGFETGHPVLKIILDNDGLSAEGFNSEESVNFDIGVIKSKARPFNPKREYIEEESVIYKNEWYIALTSTQYTHPSPSSIQWQHLPKSYAYRYFQQLNLRDLHLKVEVDNMSNLILENDVGTLNPAKPFQPFGPIPKVGSKFYIGNHEVFQKKLTSLDLDLVWADLPDSQSFKKYYTNYHAGGTVNNDNEFIVHAEKLNNGVWGDIAGRQNPTSISLFEDNINDNKTPHGKDFPTFQNVHSEKDLELENFKSLKADAQRGFIRLNLRRDFSHRFFAPSITKAVNPKAPKDPPNPPYTPTLASIKLSYCSEESIDFTTQFKSDFENRVEQLFHIEPFGWKEFFPIPNATSDKEVFVSQKLVPEFKVTLDNGGKSDAEGTLYIGLQNLDPAQNVSILFQVAEGSANPELETQPVVWSYLSHNQWMDFEIQEILSDTTNGLLTSGIVQFAMPKIMSANNTRLPSETFWIKASVADDTSAVSKIIAVMPQAVKATFDIQDGNDLERLNDALKGETISKLETRQAAIKSVLQPYASFGGKVAERIEAPKGVEKKDVLKKEYNEFYIRISERLRHKNRGITMWDYERMVLQEFPDIYKVKCINHTRLSQKGICSPEHAPGHVKVIVLPNLRNKNAVDPLRPMVSKNQLENIKIFLQGYISDFVKLEVKNPLFEQIGVEFQVKFHTGFDKGFYTTELQNDILKFLSPWLYDEGEDLAVGGKVHRSSIIHFIEKRRYVDFLTDFKMNQKIPRPDGTFRELADIEEAIASTSSSVLVSVPAIEHSIGHDIKVKCN